MNGLLSRIPRGTPSRRATGGDLVAETDAISLQRLDEASGLGRPGNLGTTYAEQEYEALGREQGAIWRAEQQASSRPVLGAAERHRAEAGEASWLVSEHRTAVAQVAEAWRHAMVTLLPFVRRPPRDGWRYLLGCLVLGLGDTAGVLGAAIWLGEVPLVALGQALATGFAAVTAGVVGGELRTQAMARSRRRDPEELTEDQRRYLRLFLGLDQELGVLKLVCFTSGLAMALTAVAIFALRSGTEGALAGLTFGALAAVTAVGSFISSYAHADEVADLLASYERQYRRAERHQRRLAGVGVIGEVAAAEAHGTALEREHDARGEAAGHKVESLKYRMLRRNPQVVGHGQAIPPEAELGPVGRRPRSERMERTDRLGEVA